MAHSTMNKQDISDRLDTLDGEANESADKARQHAMNAQRAERQSLRDACERLGGHIFKGKREQQMDIGVGSSVVLRRYRFCEVCGVSEDADADVLALNLSKDC